MVVRNAKPIELSAGAAHGLYLFRDRGRVGTGRDLDLGVLLLRAYPLLPFGRGTGEGQVWHACVCGDRFDPDITGHYQYWHGHRLMPHRWLDIAIGELWPLLFFGIYHHVRFFAEFE